MRQAAVIFVVLCLAMACAFEVESKTDAAVEAGAERASTNADVVADAAFAFASERDSRDSRAQTRERMGRKLRGLEAQLVGAESDASLLRLTRRVRALQKRIAATKRVADSQPNRVAARAAAPGEGVPAISSSAQRDGELAPMHRVVQQSRVLRLRAQAAAVPELLHALQSRVGDAVADAMSASERFLAVSQIAAAESSSSSSGAQVLCFLVSCGFPASLIHRPSSASLCG